MENSPKSGEGAAEESKELNTQPDLKKNKKKGWEAPKISRAHDFSHTHPSHAKHKTFGMDHEPGAF